MLPCFDAQCNYNYALKTKCASSSKELTETEDTGREEAVNYNIILNIPDTILVNRSSPYKHLDLWTGTVVLPWIENA